jgi:F1F0 ATPase subunit 2
MIGETYILAAAATIGLIAGLIFYGGLRMTVRRLPDSDNPHLLVLTSFWLRVLISAAAFYGIVLLGGGAVDLLVGLAAFVAVRLVMVRAEAPARKGE